MTDDSFVPKVHPLAREMETDDPLELMAQTAVGDPDVMLECLLQEFVWMGWGQQQLLALFHHPGYPLLNELRDFFGDAEVERRVAELVARIGHWQFREKLVEPEDEPHGPELLQITQGPVDY